MIAIMAIVIGSTMFNWEGINASGNFNKALSDISGILEQGRAYAVAQDTYVWVVLYENDPANSPVRTVYVGAFASNDGTDQYPLNGTGAVTLPSSTLTAITRLYKYTGLHLDNTLPTTLPATVPNPPPTPNLPATFPVFTMTAPSNAGTVTLSGASTVYWLVQFTPTGAAMNGSNPIDSIWLVLEPASGAAVLNTHSIACLKVNGVTGLNTIYR